jgi:hypothetical protein
VGVFSGFITGWTWLLYGASSHGVALGRGVSEGGAGGSVGVGICVGVCSIEATTGVSVLISVRPKVSSTTKITAIRTALAYINSTPLARYAVDQLDRAQP